METLNKKELESLVKILKDRFENNKKRHPSLTWSEVEQRLAKQPNVWVSLFKMEESGGEPDVFVLGNQTNEVAFVDFSRETPSGKGRLNGCYDRQARLERTKFPPKTSAEEEAQKMGVRLLPESWYLAMQEREELDLKTSSWIATPSSIRSLGGALHVQRRFDRVFIGANGADSYYASRGFRSMVKI